MKIMLDENLELHQELTYKEYDLLLKVVKDDIEFGKDLGIEYTDTKILNVVNNTVSIAEYITDFAIKISNVYSDYCDKNHIEPHLKSYIIGANGLPSEISNSSPILDNNTIDIDVLTFKGQNIKLRLSNLNIVTTYNLLSYEDICYIAFTVCNALNIILSSDENDLPETKSFNALYTHC